MPRQKPRPAPPSPAPPDKTPAVDKQQAFRFPPGRTMPTPAQLAKASVAKRPSPPDRAELMLRLSLRREALERLTVRAIEQGRKLEALVQDLLEDAAKDGTE